MKFLCLILALKFFVLSLLPGNNVRELEKVSALVEHYKEHKAQFQKETGIFAFLRLHYLDPGHEDPASHENLPFHNTASFIIMAFIANSFEPFLHIVAFEPETNPIVYSYKAYNSFSASIWQPPRA